MAATKKKRCADNYLTDQNWNEAEDKEPDEAGTFKIASADVITGRTLKKARRRIPGGDDTDSSAHKGSNPFSALGNFGTDKPSFNFGTKPVAVTIEAKKKEVDKAENNNNTESSCFWQISGSKTDFFDSRGAQKSETKKEIEEKTKEDANTTFDQTTGAKIYVDGDSNEEDDYLNQLSSLNHSVLSWVKKHVEKNPCIDLTPVFNDYEKHMKEIDTKYAAKKTVNSGTLQSTCATNGVFKTPENKNSLPIIISTAITKPAPTVFASSTPIQSNPLSSAPSFKSGSLFTSTPFVIKSEVSNEKVDETKPTSNAVTTEDNEDVVLERKTIVEDDAFYTIRCKLFFKKGTSWQELGIGMLYLKPTGDKIQLLVRMENSTGKVLLNISLSNDLPMSRSGKNNVMLVSVPNPPVYSKPSEGDNSLPCTYLIRVKGSTEADELLEKMTK